MWLYVIVLLVIAYLWRPTENNIRYSASLLHFFFRETVLLNTLSQRYEYMEQEEEEVELSEIALPPLQGKLILINLNGKMTTL